MLHVSVENRLIYIIYVFLKAERMEVQVSSQTLCCLDLSVSLGEVHVPLFAKASPHKGLSQFVQSPVFVAELSTGTMKAVALEHITVNVGC